MPYSDRAFVKGPLVIQRLGALVSTLPHLTPPVSQRQLPHHRLEHLTHHQKPNPSKRLQQPTLLLPHKDQMALGGLEPNPAPSTQPRARKLLTPHGSCLVSLWAAFSTPASLSLENHPRRFQKGPAPRPHPGDAGVGSLALGAGHWDLLEAPPVIPVHS